MRNMKIIIILIIKTIKLCIYIPFSHFTLNYINYILLFLHMSSTLTSRFYSQLRNSDVEERIFSRTSDETVTQFTRSQLKLTSVLITN